MGDVEFEAIDPPLWHAFKIARLSIGYQLEEILPYSKEASRDSRSFAFTTMEDLILFLRANAPEAP